MLPARQNGSNQHERPTNGGVLSVVVVVVVVAENRSATSFQTHGGCVVVVVVVLCCGTLPRTADSTFRTGALLVLGVLVCVLCFVFLARPPAWHSNTPFRPYKRTRKQD